ncbi:hypothetical protein [Marinobacter bohaiensis]|uniref:hypothetical protein n=1 Tax=Marinobacter bohaiensis TaxID=2201898 RepID=UPI000DAF0C08|nr:hypothetical protein [Marinobacter bohaiensis]
MPIWQEILLQVVVTGLTVLLVLAGFYRWVLRPYLDRKVEELKEVGQGVENRVREGVRDGVREGVMDLPESTLKESTRFGSGLVENGLSSFLGSVDAQGREGSGPARPGKSASGE